MDARRGIHRLRPRRRPRIQRQTLPQPCTICAGCRAGRLGHFVLWRRAEENRRRPFAGGLAEGKCLRLRPQGPGLAGEARRQRNAGTIDSPDGRKQLAALVPRWALSRVRQQARRSQFHRRICDGPEDSQLYAAEHELRFRTSLVARQPEHRVSSYPLVEGDADV